MWWDRAFRRQIRHAGLHPLCSTEAPQRRRLDWPGQGLVHLLRVMASTKRIDYPRHEHDFMTIPAEAAYRSARNICLTSVCAGENQSSMSSIVGSFARKKKVGVVEAVRASLSIPPLTSPLLRKPAHGPTASFSGTITNTCTAPFVPSSQSPNALHDQLA